MLSVVPAQCFGYAAKKLLAHSTGFSCYSTLRLALEGLKSRSRLGIFKSRKITMSRLYLIFLLWNYFSIQICRKNPISRLPY